MRFEVQLAGRKIGSLLLLTVLVVLAGCFVAPAQASRSTINSEWTSRPPTIDGKYTAGEWLNLQIIVRGLSYPATYVKPTFVYFMNDNSRLYVLVDAAGDTTNDALDECLLVFGFDTKVSVEIIGMSGTELHVNFDAAVGFYPSPNNSTTHKIYEFSIPFSYINAQPGQPLDFSSPLSGKHLSLLGNMPLASMPYDATTFHDNVWPVGLIESDITTYNVLDMGSTPSPVAPVGGYLETSNKLIVIAPYLALLGVLGAVIALVPRKKLGN